MFFQVRPSFPRFAWILANFAKQWSGINAVLYYAPTIFNQLGLTATTSALLATGVVGIVMFVFTIPAVLWIDRIGRKPVLTIGAIGMATCHIIIAILVAKNKDQWDSQRGAGWAAVVMVWLFVIHCESPSGLLLRRPPANFRL